MKTMFLSLFFFTTGLTSFAQLAELVQFQNKIHDFGEVVEQDGPVLFEFSFVNKSTRSIKILAVQPSCGCTTPGWSKELVAPGKMGFIKASFDPKGRPGYFNKSLSVTTDLDANTIVLQIKGNVVNKKLEIGPYDLVVENGSLRLRNTSFNVGKVFINKGPTSVEFPLFNVSNDTLRIIEVLSPDYIKITLPKAIPPASKSNIIIAYDAKLRAQYGFCTDHILIKTNDRIKPDKTFSVFATVEEFFSTLSAEQQAKAPVLFLENYQLDFGKIHLGAEVLRSLRFINKGKQELQIRYAQSNCTCLISKLSKMTLKPNEEALIELRLDPTGREGLQNKAITIYSNDPVNPVQRITIKGYIEDETKKEKN